VNDDCRNLIASFSSCGHLLLAIASIICMSSNDRRHCVHCVFGGDWNKENSKNVLLRQLAQLNNCLYAQSNWKLN